MPCWLLTRCLSRAPLLLQCTCRSIWGYSHYGCGHVYDQSRVCCPGDLVDLVVNVENSTTIKDLTFGAVDVTVTVWRTRSMSLYMYLYTRSMQHAASDCTSLALRTYGCEQLVVATTTSAKKRSACEQKGPRLSCQGCEVGPLLIVVWIPPKLLIRAS